MSSLKNVFFWVCLILLAGLPLLAMSSTSNQLQTTNVSTSIHPAVNDSSFEVNGSVIHENQHASQLNPNFEPLVNPIDKEVVTVAFSKESLEPFGEDGPEEKFSLQEKDIDTNNASLHENLINADNCDDKADCVDETKVKQAEDDAVSNLNNDTEKIGEAQQNLNFRYIELIQDTQKNHKWKTEMLKVVMNRRLIERKLINTFMMDRRADEEKLAMYGNMDGVLNVLKLIDDRFAEIMRKDQLKDDITNEDTSLESFINDEFQWDNLMVNILMQRRSSMNQAINMMTMNRLSNEQKEADYGPISNILGNIKLNDSEFLRKLSKQSLLTNEGTADIKK